MAHGFLSYEDNRGKSGIESALEKYLSDRFDDLKDRIKKGFDKTDRKINEVKVTIDEPKALAQGQTPLLRGGNDLPGAATPIQKMLGGTALQKSLPAGVARNTEVVGGPLATAGFSGKRLKPEGFVGDRIVDIGATNLGYERDLGGDDMFVKRLNTVDDGVGGGSGEVVQAIDRLTFVTMSLVSATQEQTQSQKLIAASQEQQAEKLARKAKAASEESALEMGADLSGNSAYQVLSSGAAGMMGRRGGGGPGMGIGGKIMAKRLLGSATKRGAARTGTRLGAALGGKMMGGLGARMGAKLGSKGIGKIAGGAIAKSLGKKIPLLGLGLGAVFAAQRAMEGDFLGAGLELASGAASTVPGIGTAGSIGIDAALAARDMTAMAEGGITDGPVNALIGEAGKEAVFPLEGPHGKKTFIQFGEGIVEAQRRNKTENAKRMAEGMAMYYDKQNGWEKFITMLGTFFPKFEFKWPWEKKGKGKDGDDGDDKDDDRAGRYRIDPSKFADGVYGTGLVTGPEGQIGVGTEYHLDSKFSKDMSMEDRVKLMDQLAKGYAARGREIEFSNDAVAGTIYDPNATMEEKMALLKRVQDAHSHSLHADYDSIDYYIPNIGKGRDHKSAEGAEILMPTMEGAQLQYGQGGGWGASVTMVDENGKVLMKTGHGDIRGAKTGTVDLSPPPPTPESGGDDKTKTKTKDEEKPEGNWASKVKHFGFNHSYIDFGPDNNYRAIRMDNGYAIHRKGFIQRRVSTENGANLWLKNALMEEGNARMKSATPQQNLAPADSTGADAVESSKSDQASLQPAAAPSETAAATASREVALTRETPRPAAPIVVQTASAAPAPSQSSGGNQVPIGSSHAEQGGDLYSNLRVRSLVG